MAIIPPTGAGKAGRQAQQHQHQAPRSACCLQRSALLSAARVISQAVVQPAGLGLPASAQPQPQQAPLQQHVGDMHLEHREGPGQGQHWLLPAPAHARGLHCAELPPAPPARRSLGYVNHEPQHPAWRMSCAAARAPAPPLHTAGRCLLLRCPSMQRG